MLQRIVLLALLSFIFVQPQASFGQAQAVPTLRLLGFSTKLPPGDTLECRQALAYAIDREAVARAVAPHLRQSSPRPATGIQHPALPGHNADVQGYSYDPAKAKELYGRCGWTSSIRILVSPSTSRLLETYNEAVSESLRRTLGAPVEWQRVANFDVLVQAARAGTAPIWMFAWASDPRDFGYPSFALGIGKDLVTDPEVSALVDARNAKGVEDLILRKALIIPVIYY